MKRTLIFITAVAILAACSSDDISSGDTGTGGSMARFTIKNDYLYAVDFEYMHTFNIGQPDQIQYLREQYVGFGIETIFPSDDYLFLGARNGMHIYGLENPTSPQKISFTPHFEANDPVVVQGNFAYVTLRSDFHAGGMNVLQIYNISRLNQPELIMEYQMSGPKGLGIDGDRLFVCDVNLKVYKVTDGYKLELIQTFEIPAIDVIPHAERLYVIAENGFYQYIYSEEGLTFLSKITL